MAGLFSGEKSEFKARAGTLTLLFITSDLDHEDLLEVLRRARLGGMLRPLDREEWAEQQHEVAVEIERRAEEEFEADDSFLEMKMTTTPAGEEFLFAVFALNRWLNNCPWGPIQLGSLESSEAVSTLVYCWSATVTHHLAVAPLGLEALSERVEVLEPDVLEEHLEAMVRTGLAETITGEDGTTRYALTDWQREGLAPIAAAARMECRRPEDHILPPDRLDAETAFRLSLSLVTLPPELSGSCRLSVGLDGGETAGVTATVADGRAAACESRLEERAEAWASGSAIEWLDTAVEPATARLEAGGDAALAQALVGGLHNALFGVRTL